MKKSNAILFGLLLVFAGTLWSQAPYPPQVDTSGIQVGGYLAGDYAKSEEEGLYPKGTFQNPLLGFTLAGQLAPRISFQTEASFYDGNSFDVHQAWVGLQASQYLHIKMGVYVVPFGQFNENNLPHQTDTINFPLSIAYLFPSTWRDIGVMASGNISGLLYTAYLGNGLYEESSLDSGQQFRDNNQNKAWGGRLEMSLDQGFTLGYSYYRGKYDDADSRNQIMQAATAAWVTSDFYVKAEYNHANLETPDEFADGIAWGYYIQTSMIWKSFRPVFSYQVLNYADPFHGPGFAGSDQPGQGISEEKTRWALGAVFAIAQNAYLKFEYDFNREKNLELNNDGYVIQIAVGF